MKRMIIMNVVNYVICNFLMASNDFSEDEMETISLNQWALKVGLVQNPNEELNDRFVKYNYNDYLEWCGKNGFNSEPINFYHNENNSS